MSFHARSAKGAPCYEFPNPQLPASTHPARHAGSSELPRCTGHHAQTTHVGFDALNRNDSAEGWAGLGRFKTLRTLFRPSAAELGSRDCHAAACVLSLGTLILIWRGILLPPLR